ncbi:pentatricopeptide repeat-containing protein [Senna tora]|uniref:Pentatricopeptide repeat-containing protein n=1 Tax=Senna tora TaxID=362788 RepID=A0A834VXI9_9FABA|nr:pentatricopeptide repeat-containing protein [Senna tora]KAF7800378.1 pentatricopeptide repeat-containing protein [Senna tora]KAF7800557.1 pentatricopeptide repeat-containing protein [Senna tora]
MSSSIDDLAARKSDCLETSWEASLCHRLHLDPSYAREILHRKKVHPRLIDFGWTAIHVVDRRATDSDGLETSREASLCHRLHFDPSHAREILPRKKLTHGKLNDRVTCGTRAPLTRNLGSARATAETYREVALGAKLVIYNRVPVCTLRCARFASAREKTCTSDRFDAWDLEQLFAFLVICNPSRQTKAYFWRTVFFCSSKGEGRIEATRAESQWIVAARPLCHLQYPVAYLSRLQRILPAARWEFLQGVPCGSSAARGSPTTRAFGGRGPYCWSANGRRAHASLLARILT